MNRWMRTWKRWTRHALPQPHRELAELPTLIDDDLPQPGCGWYQSSWDLQRGLAVVEGPALDPLGLWSQPDRSWRHAQA